MEVKNNFPTDFVVDNGLLRNRLRRFLCLVWVQPGRKNMPAACFYPAQRTKGAV